MTDSRLTREIEALKDKQRQPQRNLWPGIEHAIALQASANKKTRLPLYAVAASIVLMVMVGMVSFQTGQQSQSLSIAEQLSADHLQQREQLLASYQDSPVTTNNFEQQLEDLDKAAEAIKQAITQDPANPVLLQMLKRVYAQQIALIEKVHAPQWQSI